MPLANYYELADSQGHHTVSIDIYADLTNDHKVTKTYNATQLFVNEFNEDGKCKRNNYTIVKVVQHYSEIEIEPAEWEKVIYIDPTTGMFTVKHFTKAVDYWKIWV